MEMTGSIQDSDPSFDSFLVDTWIRSLACRDWVYRFNESSFVHGWSSQQVGQLRGVYESIINYLRSCVLLADPMGPHPATDICFHPRFGWSLSSTRGRACLGKASISDDLPIEIGRQAYLSGQATLRGAAPLKIGAFTSIAEGLYCNTSSDLHPTQYASMINFSSERRCGDAGLGMDIRYEQLDSQVLGVEIGNDVWLGRNVRVFYGARIADGCVIAEQSLVRGTTEPYGVYAGVPARLKKYRFPEKIIEFLLEVQWWNWSNERLLRNKNLFGTNLSQFDGDPMKLIIP